MGGASKNKKIQDRGELLTNFNTYPFFAWVKLTAEYFFHTINERQSVKEPRKTILETYIQYVTERRGVNGSVACGNL